MQLIRKFFFYLFPVAFLLPAFIILLSLNSFAADKKKFTVVIDAGHGGHDHGAIENGATEKDINLAVALRLGEMIKKKLKDTEVVYTRSTDEFISLQKRADIANKAHGDIFISLHCNSVDKKNKNRANVLGATTYVLGHHKDADNLAVAQRENAVVELDGDDSAHYSEFDPSADESFIIFNMTQKKNFQNSIRLASDIQKQMASAGRYSRGVQQAGFWVLWSTAMPAVLVEMDFICNPEQAKFLDSKEGQDKIAGAVFNAVKSYESYFRKNLGMTAANNTDEQAPAAQQPAPSQKQSQSEISTPVPIASEMAEIPASKSSRKKSTSKKETSKKVAANASDHHRRPKAAKNQGSATVQETVIPVLTEESVQVEKVKETPESESTQKATKNKKNNKNKKENSGPARRNQKDKKKATRQNVHTVYRIVLFASEEELKANADEFKGLSPVSAIHENNLFKYTYGESDSLTEMEGRLNEIKSLFPDAYVIRVFI